ncbi:MAG: signal peptidase II [Planctomycetaceae bacterium]
MTGPAAASDQTPMRGASLNRVPPGRYWLFGLLAGGALLWDLWSKSTVFERLGYPWQRSDWEWGGKLLWGDFHVQLFTTFNQGALFGIGQGWTWLFAALSLTAVGGIIYWLFVRGEAKSLWLTFTLALIFAGALGNLYDRLYLHGCTHPATGAPLTGVRDFIKCDIPFIRWNWPLAFELMPRYEWPVFNFADSYLVAGAILLTLYSLFAPRPSEPDRRGG